MFGWGYGYDYGYRGVGSIISNYYFYLAIMIALMIAAMIVSSAVKSQYKKYSRVFARSGMSAQQAAEMIMRHEGVTGVTFASTNATLSDNFDPRTNTITLSSGYGASSIAAIGVACHEAGHAIQYGKGYGPIKLRNAIIPICSISSNLALPLVIIGIILNSVTSLGYSIAIIGLVLYAIAVFFQLVTLPVEFNASNRAIRALRECGILADDELVGVKEILSAAAMTYVIAFASSLVQLLRFISILGGGRRR